jgi:hypothetical protein
LAGWVLSVYGPGQRGVFVRFRAPLQLQSIPGVLSAYIKLGSGDPNAGV